MFRRFHSRERTDPLLEYWRRQLSFVSPSETLRQVMQALAARQPGAWLRFGQADIDAALGLARPGRFPPSFASEIQKAFLLSGSNIFKSLDIESPALRLPFPPPPRPPSARQVVSRLNAVAACFLDAPIHSYSALTGATFDSPALLRQFIDTLRLLQPLRLLIERDSHQPYLDAILPGSTIHVPGRDLSTRLDELEAEVLRRAAVEPAAYPLVLFALGSPGRALALRLLRRGFPGFLLDLDDLSRLRLKAPARSSPIKSAPMLSADGSHPPSPGSLPVRWEGPFLGHFSFSVINREIASRLALRPGFDVSLQPADLPFVKDASLPADSARFQLLAERVGRPFSTQAQVYITNHVLHPYAPPSEGHWVAIQPWDYSTSLPIRWVDWVRDQLDELWVPSTFVCSNFLEAGLPPERIAVVPNGVDTSLYHPQAKKVLLNTRKSFKFLFVGGSFWRKGFDLLLKAYAQAFSARQDVTLVIKSTPEFWTEAGSRALAELRSLPGAPEVCTIIQPLGPARMAGLYTACDCLVHPYRAEGFAIVVAEAMACGLPVIVTGMGGSSDFCDPSNSFLLPAAQHRLDKKELDGMLTLDTPSYLEPDLEALVERLRFVYEHREDSAQVAQRGMQRIRTAFTWEHVTDIAARRLESLVGRPIRRFTG